MSDDFTTPMTDPRTRMAKRRALIIGIDDYRQPGLRPLRGCKNDALLIKDLLTQKYGFAADDVMLLLDAQATQEGILTALRQLGAVMQREDIVVVYYAGHGSRMPDREGTKPTGWDETIVPYDSGRAPAANRDITDDELRLWLLNVESRGAYLTLIFDCCHSGTMMRGAVPGGALRDSRGGDEETRPLSELPPSPISAAQRDRLSRAETAVDILPRSELYVILSACRDDEKAQEHRTAAEPVHGAFTYFLGESLRSPGPTVRTYWDVFEYAAQRVTALYPRQHPRIEGQTHRLLFAMACEPRARGVNVTAQEADRVVMSAGAVHGLAVGARFRLHERRSGGELSPAEVPAEVPVEVRIVEVESGVARAMILSPPRALDLPCRAVELCESDDPRRWTVHCAPPHPTLKPLLAESPWLRWAGDDEPARLSIVRRDGSPPKWIVKSGGAAELTVIDRGDRDSLLALRERLEQLVRASRVRAIGNPASEFTQQIDFHLFRRPLRGSEWLPLEAGSGGIYPCCEGERIAIEIRNRGNEPVYVGLVAVAMDHSISQIYPPIGAPAQHLAPKKVLRVGVWRLHLALSAGETTMSAGAWSEGTDLLKLFVTKKEVDYQPMLQPGVRGHGAPSSRHPLTHQLLYATTGISHRAAPSSGAEFEWASIDRALRIRAGGERSRSRFNSAVEVL
jgi:uncharacterized caspase-like protein